MGDPTEEQLQAFTTELNKSLQLLSLPKNTFEALEKIPESEVEKRATFIKKKFEDQLKNLQEGQYCLIPSILSPRNFTLAIKFGDRIKKIIGALKGDHFEIQPHYGVLIKSNHLKECIERSILFFEKQGVMPILFESHRAEVEGGAKKILEQAIENNNFLRIKALFSYMNLKEIEETLVFKAFEKSSKEIIDFLLQKIDHNELRFRQFDSREHHSKEKFEQILLYSRKRAAKTDVNNIAIAEMIRDYLSKHYPERITDTILTREKRMSEFFGFMAEFQELNLKEKNIAERRGILEQKMIAILDQLGPDAIDALNIKIGKENIYVLDIALTKGSSGFVKKILQLNATPTVGWKYETVENFNNNQRSVLKYILSKSQRSTADPEYGAICRLLENYLKGREQKLHTEAAMQLARGTFELLQTILDDSSASPPRKGKP